MALGRPIQEDMDNRDWYLLSSRTSLPLRRRKEPYSLGGTKAVAGGRNRKSMEGVFTYRYDAIFASEEIYAQL